MDFNPERLLLSETKVFLAVCRGINTPRSLACALLAQAGEWEQYIALPPCDSYSPTFPDDYLVSEMMTKNPRLPLGREKSDVAVATWVECESLCAESNYRLWHFFNSFEDRSDPREASYRQIVWKMKRTISDLLGPLTASALSRIVENSHFGPGATSDVSGARVIRSRKYAPIVSATPRLARYVPSLVGPMWGQTVSKVNLRAYSKLVTVPKNAKTDRAICVEPHMNQYVQLGIASHIRRRLSSVGIDLQTQTNNQRSASNAQRDGLATVDLSSASDLIAYELVSELLPNDWRSLFELARTPYCLLPDGSTVKLEKWSSMGNGYTFELETLIFWAACKSVGSVGPLVFGDDIIIEQDLAHSLIDTLEFLGFRVNRKKTFLAGCFFESCGSDWWNGQNVRPVYLRGDLNDFDLYWIRVCNAIRRYAYLRNGSHYSCDRRLLPAWLQAYSLLSGRAKHTFISEGFGDNGVVRDFDDHPPARASHGHEGYVGRVLQTYACKSRFTLPLGSYLASLNVGPSYSSEIFTRDDESAPAESVRGSCRVRKTLGRQVIPTWRNLGPWI